MGLSNSPDLHGQVFQRVIDDRKRLAAFYTKPVAAALLAAVTIPDQWRDAESIKSIRVADFACGTGALLLAAYRRIAANYEAASGSSMRDIHSHMMAKCLIGADVLPIAAHLTAAGLTAIYPKQRYDTTRIHQPAQGGKDSKIGSLEWIKPNATLDHSENRLTGTGMRGEVTAPAHGSHNIVLMNPPYVRSQGPGGRSDQTDMRQMFTAFGATSADRSRMSARASKLFKNPPGKCPTYCADKRAGMATFFMDLAHAKLGGGGVSRTDTPDDRRNGGQLAGVSGDSSDAVHRPSCNGWQVLSGYRYGGDHHVCPQAGRGREVVRPGSVCVTGQAAWIRIGGGVCWDGSS